MTIRSVLLVLTGMIFSTLTYTYADIHAGHVGHAGHETAPTARPVLVDVKVLIGDFFIQQDGKNAGEPLVMEIGKRYRITVVNQAAIKHELLFGRNPGQDENGFPTDYQESMLKNVPTKIKGQYVSKEGKDIFFEVEAPGLDEVEIGADTELKIIFTATEELKGDWEMGCFMPGHYMAGMRMPLVVK